MFELADACVELSRFLGEVRALACLLLLPLDGLSETLLGVALPLAPLGLLAPAALWRSRSAAVSRALVAASARLSATADAAVAAPDRATSHLVLQRCWVRQSSERLLGGCHGLARGLKHRFEIGLAL
jgi:hypothetical protein